MVTGQIATDIRVKPIKTGETGVFIDTVTELLHNLGFKRLEGQQHRLDVPADMYGDKRSIEVLAAEEGMSIVRLHGVNLNFREEGYDSNGWRLYQRVRDYLRRLRDVEIIEPKYA